MVRKVRLRDGREIEVERTSDDAPYPWKSKDPVDVDGDGEVRITFSENGEWVRGETNGVDIVAWDIDGVTPEPTPAPAPDNINHPNHYTSHPAGVECIQVTEQMPFNVGNVVKYLWRAGLKDNAPSHEDYNKAAWYLLREFKRLGVKLTVSPEVIEGLR